MKAIKATISQMIILIVVGSVVGLGVNTVRGKNHINLFRDYTPTIPSTPPAEGAADAENSEEGAKDESPFQELNVEQVIELFKDERTTYGMHMFVDARADGPYEAGHIPGALQCDYYRLDHYLMSTISGVAGAEKVIVYCNGGECEDSLYVCGELLRSEVPWNCIYLFRGGWEAWKASGMPYETGECKQQ